VPTHRAPFDRFEWLPHLQRWTALWGCPELAGELRVAVTSRMRVSLGRCYAARREIRLASFLLEAPRGLLEEVLCHEVAHAAVFALHGPAPRPHGPEWKALMRAAGFAPRVRFAAEDMARLPAAARRARVVWDHRCPHGHARRLAGRPERRWRCAACRRAGLAGVLVIERTTAEAAARSPMPEAPMALPSRQGARGWLRQGGVRRGFERLRAAFGPSPQSPPSNSAARREGQGESPCPSPKRI
jgi:predicted SprT family Zn-dependent metalloprotease